MVEVIHSTSLVGQQRDVSGCVLTKEGGKTETHLKKTNKKNKQADADI